MLEAYVAFAVCLVISLGVRIYLRWFHAPGGQDAAFEAWCRTRPVVLALYCPEHANDVYDELRALLRGETGFVNRHGGWPWQHYVLEVDYRRLAPDVVGLTLTGCRARRAGRASPRELDTVLEGLGEVAPFVDELWLHGQLHAGGHPSRYDRRRMGWVGTISPSGRLELTPAIGRPAWMGSAGERPSQDHQRPLA